MQQEILLIFHLAGFSRDVNKNHITELPPLNWILMRQARENLKKWKLPTGVRFQEGIEEGEQHSRSYYIFSTETFDATDMSINGALLKMSGQ